MRLGIDFGTTNSSVARFDGTTLHRFDLDSANDNPNVLPSLLYIDRQQQSLVGTRAATEYLEHETGRVVNWEKKRIGEIDVVAADMSFVRTVHAMVDTAAQGRLLQYIKTALRDASYQGTMVFDRFYTVDELIAIMLLALKTRAEQQLRQTSDSVVLGRPVRFSDSPAVTNRAEEILFKAGKLAGFKEIRFEMEPVGALFHYHRSARKRQTAFVFDFGGGTLDLTVAKVGAGKPPRILSTHGVLVGGDDLDRRLMQSLHKYFGADAKIDGKPALPPYLFDWLDNWQTMPILSRADFVKLIDGAERKSNNRRSIAALKALVTHNLGFKLFREIEQAKKRLSDKWITPLDFDAEQIAVHETITRREFERMIQPEVELARAGVQQALEAADIRADQIDVVLRTGGTSAVPVFRNMLATLFGNDKIADIDLLTSVVGGLAVVANEGGGARPRYEQKYDLARIPAANSIKVKGTLPGERYEFRIGAACYRDHAYTLKRVPVELSGLPAIRTAQQDKESTSKFFIQFDLESPTRVFVAYDAMVKVLPEWLREFSPLDWQVVVDQWGTERTLRVFERDFETGHVQLGGNRGRGQQGEAFMNYLVILSVIVDVG